MPVSNRSLTTKKKHTKDTHRFPTNRCGTITEWAERIDSHPTTIRQWLKSGELKTIDNLNPPLIHARDMKILLESKNKARKKPVQPDQIYCFTCREGRKPIPDSIYLEYNAQHRPVIRGICSVCEGKLFRITNASQAQQKIQELKNASHRLQKISHGNTQHGKSLFKERDFIAPYNPANERLKFNYLEYMVEAKGISDKSIKTISQNILRCEEMLDHQDFGSFRKEHAKQLKKKLKSQSLSNYTIHSCLSHFKGFMLWLKEQTGYRRKLSHEDISYLNLSIQEKRSIGCKRLQRYPSLAQVEQTVLAMPNVSDKQKRDKAMMALLALTGVRDGLVPYLQIKHLELQKKLLVVEPEEVPVKCGIYHVIPFMVHSEALEQVLFDYMELLQQRYHFCRVDPLFPKLELSWEECRFTEGRFSRETMKDAQILQRVCKQAFLDSTGEAYSPHKIRHSLSAHIKQFTQNPLEVKAASMSLGHVTTMHMMETYGQLDPERQIEVVTQLRERMKYSLSLPAIASTP